MAAYTQTVENPVYTNGDSPRNTATGTFQSLVTKGDMQKPTLSRAGSMATTTTQSYSKPFLARTSDYHNPNVIGDYDKPFLSRTSDYHNPNVIGDYDKPFLSRTLDRENPETEIGIIIPGNFYQVQVDVRDAETGDILDEEALYVGNLGVFPTLAEVNNGYATINLLGVTYDEFLVLAESGETGVDYVWYSAGTGTQSITPMFDDTGTIYVNTNKIKATGAAGFMAGSGVNFG